MGVWPWHWNQSQTSKWKLPEQLRPKKAREIWWNVKDLLTAFFDCNGVVHHEFLPQGLTVNKEYNLEVMRRLSEAIRQKRTELWKNQSMITLQVTHWCLNRNHDSTTVFTGFGPRWLKRKHFARIKEIKEISKQKLLAIPKIAFQKSFEDWKKRWNKYIPSDGSYFDGDKINTFWKN